MTWLEQLVNPQSEPLVLPDLGDLADQLDHLKNSIPSTYRMGTVMGPGPTPGTYLVAGLGESSDGTTLVADGHSYKGFAQSAIPSAVVNPAGVLSPSSITLVTPLPAAAGSGASGVIVDPTGASGTTSQFAVSNGTVQITLGTNSTQGLIAELSWSPATWPATPIITLSGLNQNAINYGLYAPAQDVSAQFFYLGLQYGPSANYPTPPPNATLIQANYLVTLPAASAYTIPPKAVVLISHHLGYPIILGQVGKQ